MGIQSSLIESRAVRNYARWNRKQIGTISQPEASSKLVYTRHNRPIRINFPLGQPKWNVFPEWIGRWPPACEAAEVISLGRTMWMLLQEVPQEDVAGLDLKVL